MGNRHKDKIFVKKKETSDFSFDEKVTSVFDDMLKRSVPLYSEIQRMMVELAARFAKDNSEIYDLGCSTGTTMSKIAEKIKSKKIKIIGIDNSIPMLKYAEKKLKKNGYWNRCELRKGDLNQPIVLNRPSVILLSLTLQFARPLQRESLIRQIYESLIKGGCLILVEKVLGNDSLTNRLFIDLYYAFKKRKGYSQLEIAQKREALENVLIPYRFEENVMLLRRNGFPIVDIFFKWYNFVGIIGIKQQP